MGFWSKLIRIKTKELEADLHPVAGNTFGGVGEIEVEWYKGGEIEVELSLKRSKIPDGTELQFVCGGNVLGSGKTTGGRFRAKQTLPEAQISSSVVIGAKAEIHINGQIRYSGVFRFD